MIQKRNSGVTVTELAISVTIIALLIAGSFGGMTLLKAAKIQKVVAEFTKNLSAINEFEKQYLYLPGDLPAATDYWTGTPTVQNGNGNGFIEETSEDLYAVQHLARSTLITGSYTGLYSNSPTNTVKYGSNNSYYSEAYNSGVYAIASRSTAPIYGVLGNYIMLGAYSSGTWPGVGVMTAKDSYAIDIKLDDGLAASGMFFAIRTSTNCTNADFTASTANYNLSDTAVDCRLIYWQRKF